MKIVGRRIEVSLEDIQYGMETHSGENSIAATAVRCLCCKVAWMDDGCLVTYRGYFRLPKKVGVLVSKINNGFSAEPISFTIQGRVR